VIIVAGAEAGMTMVVMKHGCYVQYARAREALAEHWADEILEIANDATNDWMERQRRDAATEIVLNREHVDRSRQRIDARKWLLSKAMPKVYGDKQMSKASSLWIGLRFVRRLPRSIRMKRVEYPKPLSVFVWRGISPRDAKVILAVHGLAHGIAEPQHSFDHWTAHDDPIDHPATSRIPQSVGISIIYNPDITHLGIPEIFWEKFRATCDVAAWSRLRHRMPCWLAWAGSVRIVLAGLQPRHQAETWYPPSSTEQAPPPA
jgi:hypothetical protein